MLRPFDNFFPPNINACFSDNAVDFSLNKSALNLSDEQKEYLLSHVGVDIDGVVNINQVHGEEVFFAKRKDLDETIVQDADALVTDEVDVALAVRTADCLPIFLADPGKNVIGVVHAGWKGSKQEVLVNTIDLMKRKWGCLPRDFLIGFGPVIMDCCYQVGAEFKDFFPEEIVESEGSLYLDLMAVNKRQAVQLGVREENIMESEICTCCDPHFFSYRRDGEKTGRMISIIMLHEHVVSEDLE